MRDGLDAPTLQLPADNVAELRAFLDGQARVKLAVWVRHEQHGPDGVSYDHHLVLGVDDRDWEAGDMRALEQGMALPALRLGEPTWEDIFPVSELEELRGFGTVLWEADPATSTGDDPLDYRFEWEPLEVEPSAAARFGELLAATPVIRRVEATRVRLFKGEQEIGTEEYLYVDAPGARRALSVVEEAARAAGIVASRRWGSTVGHPHDPRIRTAVLYEARV